MELQKPTAQAILKEKDNHKVEVICKQCSLSLGLTESKRAAYAQAHRWLNHTCENWVKALWAGA